MQPFSSFTQIILPAIQQKTDTVTANKPASSMKPFSTHNSIYATFYQRLLPALGHQYVLCKLERTDTVGAGDQGTVQV
jgi:hypothetical protein